MTLPPPTRSIHSAVQPGTIAFTIEELSVGGAERMVVAMANEFVALGWQVHLVCLREAGELARDLDERITLHVLHKRPGFDPRLIMRLNRCLHGIEPHAINSHLWVGNTWTRIAMLGNRVPIICTEHSRDDWKPACYRWIDRLLARRTASLVAVSGDTADFYRDTVKLNASLVTVINNGVDTVRYASGHGARLRAEWLGGDLPGQRLPDDRRLIIGTVGRIIAAKNHRRLIDVMALLRNDPALAGHELRLVMVGDGEDMDDIQRYVSEKGLQSSVIFTGMRHDIPNVMAALDLFVLSSDREGHPLTALEAQAAGTPVVLTDAGGSSEAIARHTGRSGGLLVDKSADAMADALRRMILDPSLRARLSRFAQEYALAHFDKKHMVQRYIDIIQSLRGL